MKFLVFLFAISATFTASPEPLKVKNGIVAADQAVASKAGAMILKKGGNAFDAAVTTALVLGVTNPHSSGIGGGCFILFKHHKQSNAKIIDAREQAPRKTDIKHFYKNGKLDTSLSQNGGLAVAIPNELNGLFLMHSKYGTLPWKQVVYPAYNLAKHGIYVSPYLNKTLIKHKEKFTQSTYLRDIFYKNNQALSTGTLLKQPALAKTLKSIALKGLRSFYKGSIAKEIINVVQSNGGILDAVDMANIQPQILNAVKGTYRGYSVFTMPPPSSGGLVLLQMLNVLQHYPLGDWGHNSSKTIHHVAEAMKHAYSDRAQYMGDPKFVDVPANQITSQETARKIVDKISDSKVYHSDTYGMRYLPDDHGTSHFNVFDNQGNAVSITSTINTLFGSRLVVDKYGVILNNQMDDFSLAPGIPNAYGLVGSEANSIQPHKKPLSSMTPTIVAKDKQVKLIVGGSGGPRIISGVLQVVLNSIDHNMNIKEAVDAPRMHHQWMPDKLYLEKEIPVDVVDNLKKRGHIIQRSVPRNVIQGIHIDGKDMYGASDSRKQGQAAGY
ncbi:MAG: gamma-glutamyltransferase [Candidatus Cloacimonetes bacterium]|nr:gamma-glutamyltransferase [Candidatus Cloacimonadota bacterium]